MVAGRLVSPQPLQRILAAGPNTGPHTHVPRLELDPRAHHHGALSRELKVLDGTGRVPGEAREELLAPTRHPRRAGRNDTDLREEVRGAVDVDLGLETSGGTQTQGLREVLIVLEAKARGDV